MHHLAMEAKVLGVELRLTTVHLGPVFLVHFPIWGSSLHLDCASAGLTAARLVTDEFQAAQWLAAHDLDLTGRV